MSRVWIAFDGGRLESGCNIYCCEGHCGRSRMYIILAKVKSGVIVRPKISDGIHVLEYLFWEARYSKYLVKLAYLFYD